MRASEALTESTTAIRASRRYLTCAVSRCIRWVMSNETPLSRITVDPEICHGKPCVRGLRYPVETLLEYLAGGDSIEDLLADFPDLEREDILACLEFSRRMLAAKSVHLVLA